MVAVQPGGGCSNDTRLSTQEESTDANMLGIELDDVKRITSSLAEFEKTEASIAKGPTTVGVRTLGELAVCESAGANGSMDDVADDSFDVGCNDIEQVGVSSVLQSLRLQEFDSLDSPRSRAEAETGTAPSQLEPCNPDSVAMNTLEHRPGTLIDTPVGNSILDGDGADVKASMRVRKNTKARSQPVC